MTVLTDDKVAALKALLVSTPPATASKLWALLERMKVQGVQSIPTVELLEAMREAGISSSFATGAGHFRVLSFDRLFFEPFENLFENGPLSKLTPGSLPRKGLGPAWKVISGQLAPDAFGRLEPLGTAASLNGNMSRAREHAREMRAELLAAIGDMPPERLSILGDNAETAHVLGRMPALLAAEKLGRELWHGVQSLRGDLHEQSIIRLGYAVKDAEAESPLVATELLLLTMATLPKPYQAIRVLQRVSRGADDRKLDNTHFSVIGRRVIALLRRESAVIEQASMGAAFEVPKVAAAIDRHNKLVHGMTRDSVLSPNGPWRTELTAICGLVGYRLEIICHTAVKALEQALPMDMVRKKYAGMLAEPRFGAAIDPNKLAIAECHVRFLTATRLLAPLAGFGGFRDNASRAVVAHIDSVCEGLIRVVREGETSPYLRDWIKAAATIIEAVDTPGAAKAFERRINGFLRKAA